MKAIQFKKTGAHSGNCGEVFTCLGGKIVYAGKSGSTGIQKTYERDNHTFPLQFNDWIVEMQGVIFVLSDLQYKTLSLELMNQPKEDIGNRIDALVKNTCMRVGRQSSLLTPNQNRTTSLDIQWPKL